MNHIAPGGLRCIYTFHTFFAPVEIHNRQKCTTLQKLKAGTHDTIYFLFFGLSEIRLLFTFLYDVVIINKQWERRERLFHLFALDDKEIFDFGKLELKKCADVQQHKVG